MNILFVSENFYPTLAGGQIVALELCNALSKRGYKIYVVTGKKDDTPCTETINNLEIYRPFSIGQSIFKRFIFMIRLYFFIKRFLEYRDVDIIWSFEYGSFLPATHCARIYNIPIVISVHSFTGKLWFKLTNPVSGFFKYLMEESILRFAKPDVIQVPSQYTKKAINHCVNVPIIVIPNPIDTSLIMHIKEQTDVLNVRQSLNIQEAELFLLFVGSLIPVKNAMGLIKVLSRLKKKFKLVIVGGGPERGKIEKITKDISLDGKVILFGQRPHAETLSIMASCDALVLPSKSEQCPLVVLEGLALEKPVISTKVGAVPEMIAENLYLVDNLEEINKIVEKGIEPKKDDRILKEYSMDKIVMEFENLFKKVRSSYWKRSREGYTKYEGMSSQRI